MSFLLDPSDEQFIIPDILALLEVEDDKALLTVNTSRTPARRTKVRKLNARPIKKEAATPRRPCQAKASPPRLRNKGKIELLRREIEQLEAELQQLQQLQEAAPTSPEELNANSLWKVVAMKQSQARELAEDRNRKLRRLLSAQCALTSSLSGVLDQWTALPGPNTS